MPTEVIIPALGESITSGILSSWKVEEGSYVKLDQPIYELETDKITPRRACRSFGVISFSAKEGDEVEIGSTIAKIDESAESLSSSSSPQENEEVSSTLEEKPEPATTVDSVDSESADDKKDSPSAPLEKAKPDDITSRHSPAVRKLLKESGVEPTSIEGTGKMVVSPKAMFLRQISIQPIALYKKQSPYFIFV